MKKHLLDDKEMHQRKEIIDRKRTKYLKSQNFANEMLATLAQNYNLVENSTFNRRTLFRMGPHQELFLHYHKIVDQIPTVLTESKKTQIKDSLINSYYSSLDDNLLAHEIATLKSNNHESFLLVPVIVKVESDLHLNSLIIRKKNEGLLLEIFDKNLEELFTILENENNSHFLTAEEIELVDESQKNLKTIVNYFFKIKDEYLDDLVYLLRNRNLSKSIEKSSYEVYKQISLLSDYQYYGYSVGDNQYSVGNCFIKELTGALNHTVFPEKKSAIELSNNTFGLIRSVDMLTIQQALTNSISNQLHTLNYNQEIFRAINLLFDTYSLLKEDRQTCTPDIKFYSKSKKAAIAIESIEKYNLFSKNYTVNPLDNLEFDKTDTNKIDNGNQNTIQNESILQSLEEKFATIENSIDYDPFNTELNNHKENSSNLNKKKPSFLSRLIAWFRNLFVGKKKHPKASIQNNRQKDKQKSALPIDKIIDRVSLTQQNLKTLENTRRIDSRIINR